MAPAAAARIDRSAPPAGGSIRPFRFPPSCARRLPNGLDVLAARALPELPLVSLELVAPGGRPVRSRRGSRGSPRSPPSCSTRGRARRSAMEIAAAAERLGGYFATGADWDVGYPRHRPAGAAPRATASSCWPRSPATPTFPAGGGRAAAPPAAGRDPAPRARTPSALADDRFQRVLYGGTAYAHPLIGDRGEPGGRSTATALVGFYQRALRPRRRDADRGGRPRPGGRSLREAEDAFAAAGPPAPRRRRRRRSGPPLATAISVHIVDRPGAAQTELRLGHRGRLPQPPRLPRPARCSTACWAASSPAASTSTCASATATPTAPPAASPPGMGPGPFTVSAAVATRVDGRRGPRGPLRAAPHPRGAGRAGGAGGDAELPRRASSPTRCRRSATSPSGWRPWPSSACRTTTTTRYLERIASGHPRGHPGGGAPAPRSGAASRSWRWVPPRPWSRSSRGWGR